ncbi:MAG: shikimate kinase [Acidimicrobiales bacterium]
MPDHVLLVGMMGSGKTTTGRLLASRLGRVFHDSDEEVLARTGMTIPAIFAARGEAAFRAEERTVLASAIATSTPAVIAVAGGAVLDPDSRRRVRQGGFVIWLRVAPHVLAARLGAGRGRPLLEREPAATLRLLEARRRVVYEAIADATLDVDWVEPAVTAERAERLARTWIDRDGSPKGLPSPGGVPSRPCAAAGDPAA